jgi:hypothetical protein
MQITAVRSLVIAVLLVIVGAVDGIAQTPYVSRYEEDSLQTLVDISLLISDDMEAHGPVIRSLATHLSHRQRARLYAAHSVSGGGAFALNLFVGFGVGSYVQGNIGGGVFGTLSQAVGAALYLSYAGSSRTDTEALLGAGLFVVGRLYDLIAPWAYAAGKNQELLRNLGGLKLSVNASQRYDLGAMPMVYPNVGIAMSF